MSPRTQDLSSGESANSSEKITFAKNIYDSTLNKAVSSAALSVLLLKKGLSPPAAQRDESASQTSLGRKSEQQEPAPQPDLSGDESCQQLSRRRAARREDSSVIGMVPQILSNRECASIPEEQVFIPTTVVVDTFKENSEICTATQLAHKSRGFSSPLKSVLQQDSSNREDVLNIESSRPRQRPARRQALSRVATANISTNGASTNASARESVQQQSSSNRESANFASAAERISSITNLYEHFEAVKRQGDLLSQRFERREADVSSQQDLSRGAITGASEESVLASDLDKQLDVTNSAPPEQIVSDMMKHNLLDEGSAGPFAESERQLVGFEKAMGDSDSQPVAQQEESTEQQDSSSRKSDNYSEEFLSDEARRGCVEQVGNFEDSAKLEFLPMKNIEPLDSEDLESLDLEPLNSIEKMVTRTALKKNLSIYEASDLFAERCERADGKAEFAQQNSPSEGPAQQGASNAESPRQQESDQQPCLLDGSVGGPVRQQDSSNRESANLINAAMKKQLETFVGEVAQNAAGANFAPQVVAQKDLSNIISTGSSSVIERHVDEDMQGTLDVILQADLRQKEANIAADRAEDVAERARKRIAACAEVVVECVEAFGSEGHQIFGPEDHRIDVNTFAPNLQHRGDAISILQRRRDEIDAAHMSQNQHDGINESQQDCESQQYRRRQYRQNNSARILRERHNQSISEIGLPCREVGKLFSGNNDAENLRSGAFHSGFDLGNFRRSIGLSLEDASQINRVPDGNVVEEEVSGPISKTEQISNSLDQNAIDVVVARVNTLLVNEFNSREKAYRYYNISLSESEAQQILEFIDIPEFSDVLFQHVDGIRNMRKIGRDRSSDVWEETELTDEKVAQGVLLACVEMKIRRIFANDEQRPADGNELHSIAMFRDAITLIVSEEMQSEAGCANGLLTFSKGVRDSIEEEGGLHIFAKEIIDSSTERRKEFLVKVSEILSSYFFKDGYTRYFDFLVFDQSDVESFFENDHERFVRHNFEFVLGALTQTENKDCVENLDCAKHLKDDLTLSNLKTFFYASEKEKEEFVNGVNIALVEISSDVNSLTYGDIATGYYYFSHALANELSSISCATVSDELADFFANKNASGFANKRFVEFLDSIFRNDNMHKTEKTTERTAPETITEITAPETIEGGTAPIDRGRDMAPGRDTVPININNKQPVIINKDTVSANGEPTHRNVINSTDVTRPDAAGGGERGGGDLVAITPRRRNDLGRRNSEVSDASSTSDQTELSFGERIMKRFREIMSRHSKFFLLFSPLLLFGLFLQELKFVIVDKINNSRNRNSRPNDNDELPKGSVEFDAASANVWTSVIDRPNLVGIVGPSTTIHPQSCIHVQAGIPCDQEESSVLAERIIKAKNLERIRHNIVERRAAERLLISRTESLSQGQMEERAREADRVMTSAESLALDSVGGR